LLKISNGETNSRRTSRVKLSNALQNLRSAELVRMAADDAGDYLFKHALVQDTAYASLLKHERRYLHRLIAIQTEQLYPHALNENAARLAEHYWLGEEWQRAADYSLRGGTNALRVYALREAMNHFERALAALEFVSSPSPLQIFDALLGWAEAAAKFRPYAEQLERLARAEKIARDLGDKVRLAQVLYRVGGVHTSQGHNLRASAPLAECFTLAEELGDERLTVVPTYFMGMATIDRNPRGAIPFFDQAIELARRYQDHDMEAVASTTKAWAHARVGEFATARSALEQGQALMPLVKSPMIASDVDLFTGWAFLDMGDTEQGLLYGQRGLEKAAAAENMDCVCGAYLCVGFNQLTAQRLPQAQDAFQEAIRESQFSGADAFEIMAQAGLDIARFYSGRSDAIYALERTYVLPQVMEDPPTRAFIALQLGGIYALRGDTARAQALLEDALGFFRANEMVPALARTLDALSQVYAQLGRTGEAEATRAEARHWQQTLE
jgi:tetratricopeptide (TPR) repeat protein